MEKETFDAIWIVGILTAADRRKCAPPRKTVTGVSEKASAGNKRSKDGPRTGGGCGSDRGEQPGSEEGWGAQTAGPQKGRCGWQPLTLVTMSFHQRPLMKADCQGIEREVRGGEGREGAGRGEEEGEKRIEERLR